MSCFHPLKAFEIGTKPSGKKDLKVCSYHVDHIEIDSRGRFQYALTPERGPHAFKVIRDFITIPCGQCRGCRIDYSRQWANRMVMELDYCSCACFITLTYDDEHLLDLCQREYFDLETGEVNHSYTLVKKHFQDFMKRLRSRHKDLVIRFYSCGEYGPTSQRPHFHAIIFGYDFPDRSHFGMSDLKYRYFVSDELSSLWPYGYSLVTDVSWETCAYVARYVTKKQTGKNAEFYKTFNILPEFSLMSRKPGIGWQWYQDHKTQLYDDYKIHLSTPNRGINCNPPHYFDNLFDVDFPDRLEKIKEDRRIMSDNISYGKLQKTSLSYLELLAVEEENFVKSTNALKRSKI